MSTVFAFALLTFCFCANAGRSGRQASTDELVLGDLDRRVSTLTRIMTQSQSLREQVAGDLAFHLDDPLLYGVNAGEYDPLYVQVIEQGIKSAVARTKRNQTPTSGVEAWVLDRGIAFVEARYPPLIISETEERAPLTVRFWICPDRLSALALFWLRRGGSIPDSDDDQSVEIASTFHNPLRIEDPPGESAYSFSQAFMFNAPPKKRDSVAGGDRMGFIRDNLVVEVSTLTFVRTSPSDEWVTLGMMAGGANEALTLLRALDSFILGRVGF